MKILVLNSGSSSLKYQLIDMKNEKILVEGICERIGFEQSNITYKVEAEKQTISYKMPTHKEALELVLKIIEEKSGISITKISAVGHRVVHGGEKFKSAIIVDKESLKEIIELASLAPLHNPANALGIKMCMELMSEKPNVAVFDTAFHQTIPSKAYMYALPYEDYKELSVRKYGFHGTSHKFVSTEVEKIIGKNKKIIVCHLGNGASVCAIKNGISIDTSMGMTPLQGLMMGTRCGDIDPSTIFYIMEKRNLNLHDIKDRLNNKSGMLGIFENSSDSRDIEDAIKNGDERAMLTEDMYAYRVKLYIGAYVAALGGLDAIAFTAGIGENASGLRKKICEGLEYLGVDFDKEINNTRTKGILEISKPNSKVKVFKVPTNEEYMIAQETYSILMNLPKSE